MRAGIFHMDKFTLQIFIVKSSTCTLTRYQGRICSDVLPARLRLRPQSFHFQRIHLLNICGSENFSANLVQVDITDCSLGV